MSIKRSIPSEIAGLLETGGRSFRIKGSVGTGKTTLALEIAGIMSSKGEVFYLSTRVSPEQLFAQFPWLKECLEEKNILDAKRYYIGPNTYGVGREYTDQPEFLKAINEKIQSSERRPVTIIIDSLEALKTNLHISQGDTILETILLELSEKTATNILFVSESSEESILDYLVDGVVRLEKEIMDGKLIRKMYLEKVRGEKLKQPYYLFTLSNGRFTYFDPELFPRIQYLAGKEPEKKRRGLSPTSISELDNVFRGGLRKGTLNLLEIMSGVGTEYFYFIYPIIWSFVKKRLPVLVLPSQ
ncbi:MAG: ATPase domain-containing protein, partial [Candidatus Jordarchaeaceae archaeon]